MARIRSVHPGQWTSGDFLECSPLSRLLALALRNHADDHGVFRWKPKTIKAECLPADNCDIDQLLAELVGNEQIKKYSMDGKEYGMIVDFTQWQRPKKPKYIHPIPDWFSTSTEPVENQDDTDTEIPPQRKEEGGIGSGEERAREPSKSLISEEAFETSAKVLDAMGLEREHPLSVGAPLTIQGWFNEHWNAECIVIGVKRGMQSRKGDPPTTLKYFEKAIARAHAELTPALPTVQIRQAETITVTHGRNDKSGQISAAGSKLVESLKRGFGGASPESYPGSGESDPDARLLAYRGGQ